MHTVRVVLVYTQTVSLIFHALIKLDGLIIFMHELFLLAFVNRRLRVIII